MEFIQTGIAGVMPDKKVETDENAIDERRLARPQLYYLIRMICNTNKKGFAELVGVSPATITKWLYTTTMPSAYVLAKCARRLGLEFEEFYDYFK